MNEPGKDFLIGGSGIFATITLAQFNHMVACAVGLVSLAVMALRLGREWKRKNICNNCKINDKNYEN